MHTAAALNAVAGLADTVAFLADALLLTVGVSVRTRVARVTQAPQRHSCE